MSDKAAGQKTFERAKFIALLLFCLIMVLMCYLPNIISFIFQVDESFVPDEVYLDYPYWLSALQGLIWMILIVFGLAYWNKKSGILLLFCCSAICFHLFVIYYTRKYLFVTSIETFQVVAYIGATLLHLLIPIIIMIRQSRWGKRS